MKSTIYIQETRPREELTEKSFWKIQGTHSKLRSGAGWTGGPPNPTGPTGGWPGGGLVLFFWSISLGPPGSSSKGQANLSSISQSLPPKILTVEAQFCWLRCSGRHQVGQTPQHWWTGCWFERCTRWLRRPWRWTSQKAHLNRIFSEADQLASATKAQKGSSWGKVKFFGNVLKAWKTTSSGFCILE